MSNSLITHLTLPDNQAALAPFPPGCSVLVASSCSSNSGETSAASLQTYLGQVHSVYIDLGSATRDNFYRVRPSSAAAPAAAAPAAAEDTELRSVAESDLKYAPGCTVTVNTSALPPFLAEGGGVGDTRNATIISCVGGGASGSSNYYLLDVMPGPNDSWTNIQSTVPVDSVRYRVPIEKASVVAGPPEPPAPAPAAQGPVAEANNNDNTNDDQGARVISPHPHTIPADDEGSSLNSSSRAPPVPSITINTDRKRSAEQLDCDGGSSTLSPMPTDGSISIASSNAIVEEVVRRIDIPEDVDANKVKGALVGPDSKINERMQAKFRVTISILGLDDTITSSTFESFSKLGSISYKVGDKCIMIQGSERRVHDAAKVVIHMLVNKFYDGNDKNALTRELRVVRQVRKKAELSPRSESARADLPSPTKKRKAGPAAAQGDSSPLAAAAKDPVERGWSPPIEDDHQPQIGSSHNDQSAQTAGQKHRPSSCLSGAEASPLSRPLKHSQYSKSLHEIFNSDGSLFREAAFRDEVWSVQVRSIIGERELFKNFIGTQYNIRSRLIDRFHISHIGILTDGGSQRILIEGSDKVGVMEAANYAADTMREMAKPITKQIETTLSTTCSWDGKRWLIDVVSPLSYDATFDTIVGQGGSIKDRLRKDLDCFSIFVRGGNGIRGENSALPPHVRITDGIRTIVEDAGDQIAKLLRDAKAMAASNDRASNYPPKQGRSRLLMEEPNFDGRDWMVKLLSPLDRDFTFEFIIGPRGLRKRALEQQFPGCSFFLRGKGSASNNRGGHEGNVDLPLHVLIKAPDRSSAEAASSHLTEILLNESGGTSVADLSRPDRSLCPASAVPVDTQYGMQEWKTTVFASSVRLGDTSTYFGSIVGPGGSTLRNIQKEFGVNITVLGEGVSSSDLDHDPRDPMNARIVGPSRQSVDDAALHIARLWANVAGATTHANSTTQVNPNQRQAHGVTAQPTLEARALLSGNPLYDDQSSTWFLDVFSPLDQCSTFGVLIGEGGKEKQKLIQMFDRKVFFCLRGDGLQSKNAAGDSSGPLRVFVQGPDPDVVIFAAEHIGGILLERKRAADDFSTPRNSSYQTDSTSRFGHYGDTNSEYGHDRQRTHPPQSGSLEASMKLLGEPFHTGMRWAMMVHSPLDEQPLFNIIVGGGGVNKKKLTRAFPNVFFTIAGRGVRSNDSVRMTHRKSDDPLHVLVEAADKEILLVASKHVAMIVSDAASTQSSHRYY